MMNCEPANEDQRFLQPQTRINEVISHMRQYGNARLKGRNNVVYTFLPDQVSLGQVIILKTRSDNEEWRRTIPFNGSDFAALLAQRAEGSPVI